jgi:SAM-dependent methyltransferase
VQVTVFQPGLKEGLLNTASIQAGVPVVHRAEGPRAIAKLPGASADAIFLLGGLEDVPDLDGFFSTVLRILKPGGRFIFIQAVRSGADSAFQKIAFAKTVDIDRLDPLKRAPGYESVQWDVANEALSPHVVGLAVKKPS